MEKVITTCGKVVLFGVQTPKGNTYFGDEINNLTHFMRNKSTDIVSIDGEIVPIHSEEHPSIREHTYYLEDGRVLEIKPKIDANGFTRVEAYFGRNWK
ncbi:MAG: hypothetical protein KatS3mg068_1177 [Candidatus Sericytochromatia bacterium]|nr:MAG: hypothetical protein KatS3mg068_1177 [Candidatus Sericytochromatia bacterium]